MSADDDQSMLESRLKSLSAFQAMIVRHAMSFPSVHRIVYSTCSIHEQENEQVVQDVLTRTNGAFRLVNAMPSLPCRGTISAEFAEAKCCMRLSPESSLTNGFFVACFERCSGLLKNQTLVKDASLQACGTKSQGGHKRQFSTDGNSSQMENVFGETRRSKKRKRKMAQSAVGKTKDVDVSVTAVKVEKKNEKKRRRPTVRKPVTD